MSAKINENIYQLLSERTAQTPNKTFLISSEDGREYTYGEFQKAVLETAGRIAEHGVSKGDVVSLLLPNSPEYIIAYFACFCLGAIAGPINSLLKADEIGFVIKNSDSKLLIVNSMFADATSNISDLPQMIFDRFEPDIDTKFDINEPIRSDDEAIIIYTSGTTGKPKGCLLTHENLLSNAKQIADWMNFTSEDRLLSVMPLFHMNAVSVTTMSALFAGASTVVAPKFSTSKFWDITEKYNVTSFGSVATMLSMLLSDHDQKPKDAKPASLRFAMCGSAPVPENVLKRFEETFGVLVVEGYGLSESTCRSTFNPPNKDRRPGSCGKPIGNEMKIFDADDQEIPDGELGEIVLRGPNIFKGYYKNAEATEKAFANGWFHTGDIGYRDADGFFYIADRKSDMIIRGGENIYPREIDNVLYDHEAVAAAATIGVPDELYGEEVAAFIVLRGNASEADLIEHCRKHLADFKCPKKIYFVSDIPKGPTGKLLKRELAKLIAEGKV